MKKIKEHIKNVYHQHLHHMIIELNKRVEKYKEKHNKHFPECEYCRKDIV